MHEATAAKLDEIFREVLELPVATAVGDVRQQSQPGWDSLAHVVIIAAIESEFGLSIDAADSLDLTSHEAIVRYLQERDL